jgi:hypothetical protein
MMSCQELVELVTDYFEDALEPAERARFVAHVAECAGCAAYLDQLRTTIAITGATRDLERRPEIAGLLAAFRSGPGRS